MDGEEKSMTLQENSPGDLFNRTPKETISLYLHIGMGKTGTSSIQNFMAGNTRILWKSCSCLYPNMNKKYLLSTGFINHLFLFNNPDKNLKVAEVRRAVEFCKKSSTKKLVFSAEALFESRDGPALVKELSEIPGIDLKVIVYLRRQDSWLESAWKQWGYKTKDFVDISDYIQRRDCNWYKKIQVWEQAIGKERIIVRCYEKEQLPNGLIPDFLNVLGIDYHSQNWIDRKDMFIGFQRDVMEILFLNKDFCFGNSDNRLQNFFDRNLDPSFKKESFKSYSFLSPAERIFILKKYEATNKCIAREYLNRPDGVLFYEACPSQDEQWEPYQGLTVEKIVPIFTQVLYNMDRKYNKASGNIKGKSGGKAAGRRPTGSSLILSHIRDVIEEKYHLMKIWKR